MTSRTLNSLLALGVMLPTTLIGCQTYQPHPLDTRGHIDAWLDRSIEDASLRTFIASLNESNPETPFDPTDGLDLHEAELVALYYNPDLRLARLRAGVAAAEQKHAGRWDDPGLDIDAMRIADGGNDPWIVGGSLSITIPISGRLEAERRRADANTRAAISRIAEAEWQTRIALRHAWHAWSAEELRAERTKALVDSISTLAGSTAKLAESGELPATQAALFEIERVNQFHALRRHNADAILLKQRLHAIMGLHPHAEIMLNPSLTPPNDEQQPDRDAVLEQHPTLIRMRDEYAVSEATLLREVRAQYPDLTIGPAYESEQGESRIGLVAGIPLPILNSNKQGIARARAERELARGVYESSLEAHLGRLSTALDEVAMTRILRTEIENTIAPLVDKQLLDARRLLELGESDGLVLLESLRRAGETANELIDARLAEARAITILREQIGPDATSARSAQDNNSEVTP